MEAYVDHLKETVKGKYDLRDILIGLGAIKDVREVEEDIKQLEERISTFLTVKANA